MPPMRKMGRIGLPLLVIFLVFLRLYGVDIFVDIRDRNKLCGEEPVQFRANLFRGFVLYVDLMEEDCSACFSALNIFEEIKTVYPELTYSIVINKSEQSTKYYRDWIRENVNPAFDSPIFIDNRNAFKNYYNLGVGSKVFLFDSDRQLVCALPKSQFQSGRDYLELFNDFYRSGAG